MGEVFWRQMYREARNNVRWLVSFSIAEGFVITVLAAALAWYAK